jgi:hypothetical protein
MSESCPAPQSARIPDPREVLDGIKRAKILALLTMGCSRRMAARQAGCAASTITRTAERDEEFHNQIAEAEAQADVRALRLISRTAQQEKYWRVAAWLLERRNPDEYGRRAPFTFTGTQVTELLLRGLSEIALLVNEEKLPDVMSIFHDVILDVADKALLPPMEIEELLALTLPEPKEEEANEKVKEPAPVAAPEAAKTASPKPVAASTRNGSSASPRNEQAPSRPVPPTNGRAAPPADNPIQTPRRSSCLEQFVIRSPKPELQTAGT